MNPIPFNPETMTVRDLNQVADTLRMIFDRVENPNMSPEGFRDLVQGELDGMRMSKARRENYEHLKK